MKIQDESTEPFPEGGLVPEGPFFMLEVLGIDETDGGVNTSIVTFGFEEPWQKELLKSMLEQFAASL